MSDAVLIHGCHLGTNGWDQVAFGDSETFALGRINRGIQYAWENQAELVYFGTGASEKDGVKESRYTYNLAIKNWRELARLCNADDAGGDQYESLFLRWMQQVSYIDEETQNTDQEFKKFLDMCDERNISDVAIVSSPFHIPRCLQTALKVIERSNDPRYEFYQQRLRAIPSDTNPTGIKTADVVVFEPPHRGDNASVNFGDQARRLFQFLSDPDKAAEVYDDLKALIDRHEASL